MTQEKYSNLEIHEIAAAGPVRAIQKLLQPHQNEINKNPELESLLTRIYEADQSQNKKHSNKLFKWAIQNQILEEDLGLVQHYTQLFDKHAKHENRIFKSHDINSYDKFTNWTSDCLKFERIKAGKIVPESVQTLESAYPGLKVLDTESDLTLVEITNPKTLQELTKTPITNWCVGQGSAGTYLSAFPYFYLIYKNSELYRAYAPSNGEYQDIGNVTKKPTKQEADLLCKNIKSKITKNYDALENFSEKIKKLTKEDLDLTSPGPACFYALNIAKKRTPDLEPIIATNPHYAYYYAKGVLNRRWPEAEPVIATNSQSACYYAKNILKRRWPEAEPIIATDHYAAYHYAIEILESRWPEAEPVIATKLYWKYIYERHFICKI